MSRRQYWQAGLFESKQSGSTKYSYHLEKLDSKWIRIIKVK